MINNPYQQYSNTQAMTATPGELTLMLYNGAIRFMKQAITNMEEKKIAETHNYLLRTQDIYSELLSGLDMKNEISHQLAPLYDFMKRQLIDANFKKDVQMVREVLELTEGLRDTWAQAIKLARGGQQASGN
ncbi:MAG: flagellar export chaperone FliS [Tumebacillaceae bacterium]